MSLPRLAALSTAFTASALLAPALCAQATVCASHAPGGAQSDGDSRSASISADGARVVFSSTASNLVPADTNGVSDVFVRDLASRTTLRASVSSSGAEADAASHRPAISGDGRFVAFASEAANLVPLDTNGTGDVFVHELATGITARVSMSSSGAQANGHCFRPSLSADGRFLAFASDASNLVASDTNGERDVFVHDRASGTTARASVGTGGLEAGGASSGPVLSADGRHVLFSSLAPDLAPQDANGTWDVFLHDRLLDATTCASVTPAATPGNGASFAFALSADGGMLAFWSFASDLVPADTNASADAFVQALAGGTTERVSVSSAALEGNAGSFDPTLSHDGRYVAFVSGASNLDGPDANASDDVFLRDRLTAATTRISLAADGGETDGASREPSVAADGRAIAWWSEATNVVGGDTNAQRDVFVTLRGDAAAFASFCPGDASDCPCANGGAPGHGCAHSSGAGALLAGSGAASLAADSARLDAALLPPGVTCIAVQGRLAVPPSSFGDGVRCAGGGLLRLYVVSAAGGSASFPPNGASPISARSAELGDPIPFGATRIYQVVYRDPDPSFCAAPAGGTFNASNAVAIAWGG